MTMAGPSQITADERLVEIGELLALGLVRLYERQNRRSAGDKRDIPLDFVGDQSGHRNAETERLG